jgi:hypothetical protein
LINEQDLADLAVRLADVEGFQATTDMVQCVDPNGMTIRFQKSFTQELPTLKQKGLISTATINRVNAASPVYEKGQPVAIGHVVFSHLIWKKPKNSILKSRFHLIRCLSQSWCILTLPR